MPRKSRAPCKCAHLACSRLTSANDKSALAEQRLRARPISRAKGPSQSERSITSAADFRRKSLSKSAANRANKQTNEWRSLTNTTRKQRRKHRPASERRRNPSNGLRRRRNSRLGAFSAARFCVVCIRRSGRRRRRKRARKRATRNCSAAAAAAARDDDNGHYCRQAARDAPPSRRCLMVRAQVRRLRDFARARR